MRFIQKLLLGYSLLLSVGITTVGIVTSRSAQALLTPLLFMPVALFLLLTAVKKSDIDATEKRQKEVSVFAFIFVLLLFLGVSNVHGSKQQDSKQDVDIESKPIIFSQNKQTVLQTLTVTLTKKTYLDVKSKPDEESGSIAKVYDGEILNYLSKSDSWYEVVLSENQRGYIKETNVRLNQ